MQQGKREFEQAIDCAENIASDFDALVEGLKKKSAELDRPTPVEDVRKSKPALA